MSLFREKGPRDESGSGKAGVPGKGGVLGGAGRLVVARGALLHPEGLAGASSWCFYQEPQRRGQGCWPHGPSLGPELVI